MGAGPQARTRCEGDGDGRVIWLGFLQCNRHEQRAERAHGLGRPQDRGAGILPRTVYLRANGIGRDDENDWKRSDRHDDDDRGHERRIPKVYTLTATATVLAGNTTKGDIDMHGAELLLSAFAIL